MWLQRTAVYRKEKIQRAKKCRSHRVFRASAEPLVNVYQITGCTVTVASFEITAPDRHSQQAEPKWQVAAHIASNTAASSWQSEASREELVCFQLQKRHQELH